MTDSGQNKTARISDAKQAMASWSAFNSAHLSNQQDSAPGDALNTGYALNSASGYCLPQGVEGMILGAAPARQLLVEAKDLVSYALRTGIVSVLTPGLLRYNDNNQLDRDHATAYQTRYLADVLLDAGDHADVRLGMQHLERLIRGTSGLSGDIAVRRARIFSMYLWFGIIGRSCDAPLEAAASYAGGKMTPASRITSYKQDRAYVRMLFLVARYVAGGQEFYKAARASLRSLLKLHLEQWPVTPSHVSWPSQGDEFAWAWLWESVFEPHPDANHAIEILRGNVELA
jgi:hypothetical protein